MAFLRKIFNRLSAPFVEKKETPHHSFYKLLGFRYHRISDPAVIGALLQDEEHFGGPAFQRELTGQVIGNALINSEGDSWKKQRRLFQGFFTSRAIEKNISPLINEESRAMIDRWLAARQPIDVEREMRELTGRIIIGSIFGDSIPDKEAHDIIEAISNATIQSFRGLTTAGVALRATGLHRISGLEFLDRLGGEMPDYYRSEDYLTAKEGIDSIIFRVIRERRQLEAQPDDLLGAMIDPPVDRKTGERLIEPMTDEEIRDQIVMFIVAGHDTTSVGLTYALLETLKHPEILAQIRAEIDRNIGSRPIEPADFNKLPSLQQAFKEAVRLHPPSHSVGREAKADAKIGDIQFKKGDLIKIDIPPGLRSDDFWQQAEQFDPDRMPSGYRIDQNFIAFGRGPRTCIGMPLANTEATLALAAIFQRASLKILQEPAGEDFSGFSTSIKGKAICSVAARPADGSDIVLPENPVPPPPDGKKPGGGGCPFHRWL